MCVCGSYIEIMYSCNENYSTYSAHMKAKNTVIIYEWKSYVEVHNTIQVQ